MTNKQTTIPTIHTSFNAFRAQRGLQPVKPQTIRRYIDGGKGYENGPPALFKQYLKASI